MGDKNVKRYTVSITVRGFWLIFVPLLIFLTSVGGLAGYFVVDRYVMPRIVGVTRDVVKVPDVKGMPYEDGRTKFFGVGLLTEIRARDFDDDVPEGMIISQFPEPDSLVKKGRRIAVTVSRGPETGTIPAVYKLSEAHARSELRNKGFSVGSVRKTYHGSIPMNTAIGTDPPSGTTTSRAIDVALIMSRGPRPTHADMPNVIGESLAEARKKIEEAGLKVGSVEHQNNSSIPPGSVISQSVAPGARAPFESRVNLVISARR